MRSDEMPILPSILSLTAKGNVTTEEAHRHAALEYSSKPLTKGSQRVSKRQSLKKASRLNTVLPPFWKANTNGHFCAIWTCVTSPVHLAYKTDLIMALTIQDYNNMLPAWQSAQGELLFWFKWFQDNHALQRALCYTSVDSGCKFSRCVSCQQRAVYDATHTWSPHSLSSFHPWNHFPKTLPAPTHCHNYRQEPAHTICWGQVGLFCSL